MKEPFYQKWADMIEQLAYKLFGYLGLNRLARFLVRDKIIILMLHGVCPQSFAGHWRPSWGRPSPEELDLIVGAYSKYFTFISMDTAEQMLRGEIPMQRNCMVLTFDDGYKNNIDYAYPVLKKYNIPMIVYPATANVELQQPYWIDRLDYVLQELPVSEYELVLPKLRCRIRTEPRAVFVEDYRLARIQIKNTYNNDYEMLEDIETVIKELEQQLGKRLSDISSNDPASSILTKAELSSVPSLVTIGSHTLSHIRSTHVSFESLMCELSSSKIMIEEWTEKPCIHFCYPNGDFNSDTASLVERAGYHSAVTTEKGFNSPKDSLFMLKRIPFPVAKTKLEALYKLTIIIWKSSKIRFFY